MKRLLSLVITFTLFVAPVVNAAPKKISVKPMQTLASIGTPDEVSGVVVAGKSIVIYGTKQQKAYVRAIDSTGQELWNLPLDQSQASIATAAAVDAAGDIWVAGSTPLATGLIPPNTDVATLDPDNANLPPDTFISDLRVISLWKVSSTGSLLTTKTLPTSFVLFPTAMSVDKKGASVVGIMATDNGNAGFVTNVDLEGNFSKLLQIGAASTTAEAVVRHSDGTLTVVGSSAETLGGKKLAGIVDGVLIKISQGLKITLVVRSSAAKGTRIWNTASSTLLLGGEVTVGKKIESAVTKFSSKFVPQWSYRFASVGSTKTLGSTSAVFVSTGPVAQLNWNPKNATVLLLTFDAKGAIAAADSAPGDQKEVITLLKSKDLGVLMVSSSADLVSIFTPVSR